jgi:hypothetical protein
MSPPINALKSRGLDVMGASHGFSVADEEDRGGVGIGPWPGTERVSDASPSPFFGARLSSMPPHRSLWNSLSAVAKDFTKLAMNGSADHTKLKRM